MKRPVLHAFFVLFCFCISTTATATIYFNDGQVHDFNYATTELIYVDYHSPGVGTTLNVIDGADIDGILDACSDSEVYVSGGYVRDLRAHDNAHIEITSGQIGIDGIRAYHNSTVTVYDVIDLGMIASNSNSLVTVYNGLFGNIQANDGIVNFYDGEVIDYVYPYGSGLVNIYGGTLGDETNDCRLIADEFGTITFYGSGFNYPYGELTGYGTLTGTLANGDILNNVFGTTANGKIILAPVPEPATILLLTLGTLLLREKRG